MVISFELSTSQCKLSVGPRNKTKRNVIKQHNIDLKVKEKFTLPIE